MFFLSFSLKSRKYTEYCSFFDISDFPVFLYELQAKYPGVRWKLTGESLTQLRKGRSYAAM